MTELAAAAASPDHPTYAEEDVLYAVIICTGCDELFDLDVTDPDGYTSFCPTCIHAGRSY